MFPQFMCIGAQKAGTTWLHHNMKDHAEIWLPPIKELHYFNMLSHEPALIALAREPLSRFRLRRLLRKTRREMLAGRSIRWYPKYFLMPRSDWWYSSLFTPAAGQIAGEMTPEYSILSPEVVQRIHRNMPDLKVIYLLRNPIERTWSQVNRGHRQSLFGENFNSDAVIEAFMQQEHPHQRSSYYQNLQVWESIFPAEQIFVGFYEQVREEPEALLRDVYEFLGVDASEKYIQRPSEKKVNVGSYESIPAHWGCYLAERYYTQIQSIHNRFSNAATLSWLTMADNYLCSMPRSLVNEKQTV